MSDQNMSALSVDAAKKLATETKTRIQIEGRTPRWFLQLLPFVDVPSGTYRVNRRARIEIAPPKLKALVEGGVASLPPESLRQVPLFSACNDDTLKSIVSKLEVMDVQPGQQVTRIGDPGEVLFILVSGKVEVSILDKSGTKQVVAVLSEGDYFGEMALLHGGKRTANVVSVQASTFLTLKRDVFIKALEANPGMRQAIDERLARRAAELAAVNAWGERAPNITTGPEEGQTIGQTFADYDRMPQEYPLEILQAVVRVQSRVADLYNGPINQVEEQLRNAIEEIRERQEWELINHPRYGLLAQADRSMRIPTRSGPPTPDDLDELLSLVWKEPAFFLAHPKAIAAFGRECTLRGVPPPTMHLGGSPVLTWRGVPLIPTDKLLVNGLQRPNSSAGTTNIVLMRVGEAKQGVVGLKAAAVPGEQSPSLSVRLMGINQSAMQEYLLTLYYNLAVLTSDAVGVLENCDVGTFHGYKKRAD